MKNTLSTKKFILLWEIEFVLNTIAQLTALALIAFLLFNVIGWFVIGPIALYLFLYALMRNHTYSFIYQLVYGKSVK